MIGYLSMEEIFPNEYFFVVTVKKPCHVDVTHYLEIQKFIAHLLSRENKLIIKCSARFSSIDYYLFHTGSDLQIRSYIKEDKIYDILKAFHDEPYSAKFANQRTGHKVL